MGINFSKQSTDDTNVEEFSLVWLDAQVNTSEENLKAQEKLRATINRLITFENERSCEQHLQSASENDRIVFISSGNLGKSIVPRIHQLRQVYSIYIYCTYKKKHEEWADYFIKVRGVYIILNELINAIRNDQERRKHQKIDEQLSIGIYHMDDSEKQWKKESNQHFIYSQILINCLLQLPRNASTKNELYLFCKREYRENGRELQLIGTFEREYASNHAIRWYTRESFLYKMLIKALKIQNLDILFLFHYVMSDIQNQLKANKQSSLPTIVPVYRSQLMTKNEFQLLRESLEQFLSINSFLSAIPDRKTALLALHDAKVSDDIERVLFEITTDGSFNGIQLFKNIKSNSYYHHDEILFPLGTIFQLTDIQRHDNNIKIIKMILCTGEHPTLKTVFNKIENQYGNSTTSLLTFGSVARHMKKFDEAEKYYNLLLKNLPANDGCRIECAKALETIFYEKENHKQTLNIMDVCIKDYDIKSKKNDYPLIFQYRYQAEEYRRKGDIEHALEYYEKELNIWKKSYNDNHQAIGSCYNNMALLYQENQDYEKALEFFQKAIPFLEKFLSRDHSDLSTIYYNIANVYKHLDQYDEALIDYKNSLEIVEQLTDPENHPSAVSIINKIAEIYEKKKDYQTALDYYNKISSLLPSTHEDFNKNDENIQRVTSLLQ